MKRLLDIAGSLIGLLVASPVLLPMMLLIWLQDRHSPLYVAPRVGKDDRDFNMVKLRSMVWDAHKRGWDSTSADDDRITPVGHFVRGYKIDELPQLWNVLRGDMSLVGPRPNVRRETSMYSPFERRLLEVRPGVTDFSSIVYADLGEILKGSPDPNVAYRQLVRPGKSALGVFYVDKKSWLVDLCLIWLTLVGFVSRRHALAGVLRLLRSLDASDELLAFVEQRC